jgi:MinD-like ATPase involved in chromosome partitioning or flagellar assembly
MTRCIAFHSYKGGSGKTTIASNLAAMLATKGFRVALLDLDVYAPSLQAYFDYSPGEWINDYLHDLASAENVMIDMTHRIEEYVDMATMKGSGKLWVGFANPDKDAVIKLEGEGRQTGTNIQLLRKFIQLREKLISDFDCDYIIIDTSPGIRYWSINSLAIADILLLTLKFDKLDINGTRKMAHDIYDSLKKLGAKSFLLPNRMSGYCVPHTLVLNEKAHSTLQQTGSDLSTTLSREIGMDIIAAIPCYCDIQFSTDEFLSVLRHPEHPFAKQLEGLAAAEQLRV